MPTIAYLSNCFPAAVEPYVAQEVTELRSRGIIVIPYSARRSVGMGPEAKLWRAQTVYITPIRLHICIKAVALCLRNIGILSDFAARILFRGSESPYRRLKALAHTFLGAYFSLLLEGTEASHIHIHHGYFACWIGMVAARLRGISYSVTLHGSDLLLHGAYLDTKLLNSSFCATVSQFNREYILNHVSGIDAKKVFVRRTGVDCIPTSVERSSANSLAMLAVGRLHPVKNYEFLIEACGRLKRRGHSFSCQIAGQGREYAALRRCVRKFRLEREITFAGHLSYSRLEAAYAESNLVVLTSHSEGLPLVLMEAMARGRIVLAPAITGIPELITDGCNGFLFRAGSLDDFVNKVEAVRNSSPEFLCKVRLAARKTILERFDRDANVAAFIDLLIQGSSRRPGNDLYENLVLQQI